MGRMWRARTGECDDKPTAAVSSTTRCNTGSTATLEGQCNYPRARKGLIDINACNHGRDTLAGSLAPTAGGDMRRQRAAMHRIITRGSVPSTPASSTPSFAASPAAMGDISGVSACDSSMASDSTMSSARTTPKPRAQHGSRTMASVKERMSYIISAGRKSVPGRVYAVSVVEKLGLTHAWQVDVIAGAFEWAFDWFDINHLPSLRLITQGHQMWCFRCGECVNLNHHSNMTSHAKSQMHAAAVVKDSRALPTDEQVSELIAGTSDTRTRRAVRSRCRDVHAVHCDGECPLDRHTEELRCDAVVGEAVPSAPPRLQPKVNVPKTVNDVVEELWHGPLKPLCGQPYYLTIDESDMRRCGGRSILQVHLYSTLAEKPVLASTVVNKGKANRLDLYDALLRVANFMDPDQLMRVAADIAAVCRCAPLQRGSFKQRTSTCSTSSALRTVCSCA
ncbi:MAG: hypothetical protein EOO65_03030 [Methanosarcinales archaeon]|nr:MAG: hypothetical protein EOO65_03030 [Methanosarcinales archaeon]